MSNVYTRILIPGCIALLCAMPLGCSQDSESTTAKADRQPSAPAAAASALVAAPKEPESAKKPSVIAAPQPVGRSSAAKNPPNWPPVEMDPKEMQFGVLPPDGKGEGEASLFNVGSQVLKIIASRGSCSCVDAPNLAGKSIPPGGSIRFRTGMTMKSGLGEKHQRVVLLFEGYDDPVLYDLYAEVSLSVRLAPPFLAATESLSGTVEAVSQDDRPFRVLAANRKPPQFVGFNPETDAPRTRYTLKWDITAEDLAKTVPWFWVVETDREDCPVVDVRIRHASTKPDHPRDRPWQPGDQRILVGNVVPGKSMEVVTHIQYDARFTPSRQTASARSDSKLMTVELIDAQVDGQELDLHLKVTPSPQEPGLFYERLFVTADGFSTPVTIIGRYAK